MATLISIEAITNRIFMIRGRKVMLDRDLAQLYEVTTKRLNEQVKRNLKRFPKDFMFQLTKKEKDGLVAICDRFNTMKHSTVLPYAFTEQGRIRPHRRWGTCLSDKARCILTKLPLGVE